ncbi:MAG: zinc ribbon domain-containing protein [Lachnospiraceae bacterium]|nr:zinc ribbon domain-containing protein [Lachnospiraceae bacterium]
MKEMIICPNCGAEIDKDVTKCPYCEFINREGAEKKFRKDIEQIRENIEETKKEPPKALVKGFTGGAKVILITVLVLVLLGALFFLELLRETKDKPKLFPTKEEQEYAAAYTLVAGQQLTEGYEAGDIARMAEIFDKAYSVDRVSIWGAPYYEVGFASSNYMKLQDCLPNLDKDKRSAHEAEEITYYCFYFYYRAYGEEGAELFDPIRETEILPIITDRLGFTTEDMESFREKVFDGTNVNRSAVYKATKKDFKKYH